MVSCYAAIKNQYKSKVIKIPNLKCLLEADEGKVGMCCVGFFSAFLPCSISPYLLLVIESDPTKAGVVRKKQGNVSVD